MHSSGLLGVGEGFERVWICLWTRILGALSGFCGPVVLFCCRLLYVFLGFVLGCFFGLASNLGFCCVWIRRETAQKGGGWRKKAADAAGLGLEKFGLQARLYMMHAVAGCFVGLLKKRGV